MNAGKMSVYDWEPVYFAPIVLCILSRDECVHVSQLAATGTVECNKSQMELASSRCTLVPSILLSLCALFSPWTNTQTLNSAHTRLHRGAWMHGRSREGTRWRALTPTRCLQAEWLPTSLYTYTHTHTHTYTRTQTHTSSPGVWKHMWSRHMEILHMIFFLIMWSRRRL